MQRSRSLATVAVALTALSLTAATMHAESESDAYATPAEDFSVKALENGYSLNDAKRLHAAWSLGNFLDITESGAYSYFFLPEFMPHAVIRRDGPVLELPVVPSESLARFSLPGANGRAVGLDEMITADKSPVQGFMVVQQGTVIYEAYPGMKKTDRHVWMSNAKVIAGLIIAMLEEDGQLIVTEPVSAYVRAARGTAWESVSVLDVLNMQSGLDLEENPATRKGDTPYAAFVASEVGQPTQSGERLTHDEALLRIPKLKAPGTAFEYSSANTQMLGLIIEAITQKRLAEVVTERIWMRAKMTGDATLGLSPQGNGIIHGLVSTRLDDMAKFGMLFTPSSVLVAKNPIVTPNVLRKMQAGGVRENFLRGTLGPRLVDEFRDEPLFNSYQWDAVFADGDLYKSGMNGQGLYVSPSRDAVVAWFATGFPEIPLEAFSRAIVKSL